jgi:osmotically-inducible protein OsmY
MKRLFMIVVSSLLMFSLAFGQDFTSMGKITTAVKQNEEDKVKESGDAAAEKSAAKAEEYANDLSITNAVKIALLGTETLQDSKIEVTTAKCIVTISGTVKGARGKREAIKIASLVKGVKSVDSKLIIEKAAKKTVKKSKNKARKK